MEDALKSSPKDNTHCYLIAPAKVETRALRMVLADLGVSVDSIDDLPPPGESLASELVQRLRMADFVCGVLSQDVFWGRSNVVFELGVAMGMGLPIFLITNSKKQMPNTLRAFPSLAAGVEDVEAIKFHINAFLKNMDTTTRTALEPRKTPIGLSQKHFDRVNELRRGTVVPQLSEKDLVELASQAFRAIGTGTSIDTPIGSRSRPDIVAWPADTSSDLGSPILVEIKKHERAVAPRQGVEQLASYMEVAGVRTGVLLIPGIGPQISVEIAATGYIFTLSFETFLALTENGNFFRALIEARNRFFHGF